MAADDAPGSDRFRRLPEPIRLAQTTTTQDTSLVYTAAGMIPAMAIVMGPDGAGGGDGD